MVKELIETVRKAQIAVEDVKDIMQILVKENQEVEGKNIRLWNENERLKKEIVRLGGKVE